MKKRWLIFIYVFTHLGLVFRLIWFNYKKKQTRLTVAILSQTETPNFGNEVEIDFMQQGAILIVINGQFVFPLLNGDGRFKIPVALIESNQIVVSVIGLFQTYSKRLTLEVPIGASLTKQLQPSQMLLKKIRSAKVFNEQITLPVSVALQLKSSEKPSGLVFKKISLSSKVGQLEMVQTSFPELHNEEQTLSELNKNHRYE